MKHNWEYKRLGSFLKTTSGGTPLKGVSDYYDNGTIPWLRSGEVCKKEILDCEIYITQKAVDESSAKLIPANSVVMAMYGATAGQVGIIRKRMTTNQAICSIFPSQFYTQDFLYYYLSSLKDKLVEKAYGAAQPNISQTIIKSLSIPVPPMEEQEQIVAELDKINEVIEDCRELLRSLDALAQSIFYDYFGDPILNPKGWTMKLWGDCLNIINGKNQKAVENPNGQFPIYGSGGIMNYADAYLCPEYCTIIGRKGNISKPIFVKTKFWNVDTAFGLCPDKSILAPLYLYFFCKNYDFEKHNKAVTIPSLVKGDLLKIQIPVPPLELQEKFAERIEQIDAQKKAVEETIANLQTLLDSRMDYWFN